MRSELYAILKAKLHCDGGGSVRWRRETRGVPIRPARTNRPCFCGERRPQRRGYRPAVALLAAGRVGVCWTTGGGTSERFGEILSVERKKILSAKPLAKATMYCAPEVRKAPSSAPTCNTGKSTIRSCKNRVTMPAANAPSTERKNN